MPLSQSEHVNSYPRKIHYQDATATEKFSVLGGLDSNVVAFGVGYAGDEATNQWCLLRVMITDCMHVCIAIPKGWVHR